MERGWGWNGGKVVVEFRGLGWVWSERSGVRVGDEGEGWDEGRMRVTAAAAKTKATKLITEPSRKVAVPDHMTRLGRLGVYTVMGVTAWGLEQLIRS